MPHTTVKKAIEWLAQEKGRNIKSQRHELVTLLNDVRRLFYSLNQRIRLDFHIEGCFVVQEFHEPCIKCGDCPASYLGVTLPQEIETVEAIWSHTSPVTIYNRWVEYSDGISGRGSALKMIDAGNDHPLQIEWDPKTCIRPVFMATNMADCGKEVTVSFKDANFEDKRETVKLAMTGVSTTSEVRQLTRPGGIVLPNDLVGGVEVYDCIGGQHLGYLSPKEVVPGFRRVKISSVCCGSVVKIVGSRKFSELEFDWEVVETDNKLAILEASRYLSIMSVNSSDAQWLAKARQHMDNMIAFLGGDNLRNEGPTVVRHMDFHKVPLRRSGLTSKR